MSPFYYLKKSLYEFNSYPLRTVYEYVKKNNEIDIVFSMNFKIKNNTLPGITRILRNMHHGGFPAQAMDLINPLVQKPSVHAHQSSHHYRVSSVQVLQDIGAFTQEYMYNTLTVNFPNNEQSILLKVSTFLYMIEAIIKYF